MSVRINLEIGHEASIRTKRTQEGFTHDWEVFVRGTDGAPIQHYVEKVVFILHDTFQKPRRVIKEPPYKVKESGYAGFTLPIEIYLRNKEEPKKISFNYDLQLQPSGPAINNVQKEKYLFANPCEDFKVKLLKGGAIINSSSYQDVHRDSRSMLDEKSQLISKPKLGGSDFTFKKHKSKFEDFRSFNAFQDLFGTPITPMTKPSKVPAVDTKNISKDKNSNINKSSASEKEKLKTKYSPHKEKEKSKDKSGDLERKSKEDKKKDEKKDYYKDRDDKLKDKKEKRDKSPKARSLTPNSKRSSSPKRSLSPILKHKEKSKKNEDKLEKKSKKDKRDKEKERKDGKHKEREKIPDQKDNKTNTKEKEMVKEKDSCLSPHKHERSDKGNREKDLGRDIRENEYLEKNGKLKIEKSESKPKHKSRKKDKEKREKEKSCDREKSHQFDKKNLEKSTISSKYVETSKDSMKESIKSSLFDSPKNSLTIDKTNEKSKKPLNMLLAQNDSSNSSTSSQEDSIGEPSTKTDVKKDLLFEGSPNKVDSMDVDSDVPSGKLDTRIKDELSQSKSDTKLKSKREKSKKSKDKKSERDVEKKRKRKSENLDKDESSKKVLKSDFCNNKESDESNLVSAAELEEAHEQYMQMLRELQHKILNLQDNSQLQKVVEVIAETGRFEVSALTFDFDLCVLEYSTIKQLQKFFDDTT